MRTERPRTTRRATAILTVAGSLLIAALAASPAGAATATFSNPSRVVIPDEGIANPYPSPIAVAGMPGTVTGLSVSLDTFVHDYPDDLGIALVAPNGGAYLLSHDAGGSEPVFLDVTLSDAGAAQIPDTPPWVSGTYRPANYDTGPTFTAPGPGATYANPGPFGGGTATLNGTFAGFAPEGDWKLFVQDFSSSDAGALADGWRLKLTTNEPPPTKITKKPKNDTDSESAKFKFRSIPGATFLCKRDKKKPKECTSPKTYKNLGPGKHTFKVRAVDEGGERDPKPAKDSWEVED